MDTERKKTVSPEGVLAFRRTKKERDHYEQQ